MIHKESSFAETLSLKQGLKRFGERGHNAAVKEMYQLHARGCFAPISVDDMTTLEKKRALESLIFLTEKRDGTIKGRACANGSPQRVWTDKEDASSPTAMTEAIILSSVIEAKEHRNVAVLDIPNAFIQTPVGKREKGERIIMKI